MTDASLPVPSAGTSASIGQAVPREYAMSGEHVAPRAQIGPKIMLSSRQKRLARIAGALALPLLTIGIDVILGVLVFVGFWLIVVLLFSAFDDSPTSGQAGFGDLSTLTFVGVAAMPVIIGVAAAILLGITGFLLSWLLLRRARVRRPAAVTWAGIGVCFVPQLAVVSVAYSLSNTVVATLVSPGNAGEVRWEIYAAAAALTAIVSAVIGAFAWWWMAHALRGRSLPSAMPPTLTPDAEATATLPRA
ncbi:hypothetical protein KPL76_09055 [Subtercola sp. PAMC28395]|uniref:hypothetical protein n=1 Tax=Subtercola sp. PAMC28395 TaxID=2846775 RepID=UPI001C0C8A86|nr:hypothetical protein [Subtercola sp. PAMC28395]QWT22934.1 hypothetical protein KPL76_09055 [Subtercola sp. PAMC28395]